MPIITLTTDFGLRDSYVAQMKGVILSLCPGAGATVVDVSHEVEPGGLVMGAVVLESAVDAFPAGTVHVVVVDPGVGTARAALAVRTPRYWFVGPDNGVLTAVLRRHPALEVVALDPARLHGRPVSATFHGRDIFAPAAALLARGEPLARLGRHHEKLSELDLPTPTESADGLIAHVLYADHFGNLITDVTTEHLGERQPTTVRVGDATLPWVRTFGEVASGQPLAYWGSGGRLEIAVRAGNAANRFGDRPTVLIR